MKRVVFTIAVLLCLTMMMTGMDIRTMIKVKETNTTRKNCVGYTILEFDKGVDCYGDTVMLTKVHGYYEVVQTNAMLRE
jgi:hypothetical protein